MPVAIVILEWNSEKVVFQDFIGKDWPFYSFTIAGVSKFVTRQYV